MPQNISELRITPFLVPASSTIEVETFDARSIILAESVIHGTSVAELEIAFGDMGEFAKLSPGDCFHFSEPVKRIRIKNNIAADRRGVLWLHQDQTFRFFNQPRAL